MLVDVLRIRVDGDTQPRAGLNQETIAAMREDIKAGDRMPPVVLFQESDGGEYWLADGFHRVVAHRQEGKAVVDADVRRGTARDAYLEALRLNKSSNALSLDEKRAAVRRMLADAEWSQWSAREIGRRVGMKHDTVSKIKDELSGQKGQMRERVEFNEETDNMKPDAADETKPEPQSQPAGTVKFERGGKVHTMRPAAKKGRAPRLSLKAMSMLKDTDVANDQKQKRQLASLNRSLQVSIARLIRDGEAPTVKAAEEAIMRGAPTDKWSRAYAAVNELDLDDRIRLCRLILSESERPLSVVK